MSWDMDFGWDTFQCPCGREAGMGILSLVARCECGHFYADVSDGRGWYESEEAYYRGDSRLGLMANWRELAKEPK